MIARLADPAHVIVLYMPSLVERPETGTLPPLMDAEEGHLMMALKFPEIDRLTLGQAAAVAGYSKRTFMDILAHYGIAVVNYPAAGLASEMDC